MLEAVVAMNTSIPWITDITGGDQRGGGKNNSEQRQKTSQLARPQRIERYRRRFYKGCAGLHYLQDTRPAVNLFLVSSTHSSTTPSSQESPPPPRDESQMPAVIDGQQSQIRIAAKRRMIVHGKRHQRIVFGDDQQRRHTNFFEVLIGRLRPIIIRRQFRSRTFARCRNRRSRRWCGFCRGAPANKFPGPVAPVSGSLPLSANRNRRS